MWYYNASLLYTRDTIPQNVGGLDRLAGPEPQFVASRPRFCFVGSQSVQNSHKAAIAPRVVEYHILLHGSEYAPLNYKRVGPTGCPRKHGFYRKTSKESRSARRFRGACCWAEHVDVSHLRHPASRIDGHTCFVVWYRRIQSTAASLYWHRTHLPLVYHQGHHHVLPCGWTRPPPRPALPVCPSYQQPAGRIVVGRGTLEFELAAGMPPTLRTATYRYSKSTKMHTSTMYSTCVLLVMHFPTNYIIRYMTLYRYWFS